MVESVYMLSRLQKFIQIFQQHKLDGFIVTNQINIFYLVGFRGVDPQDREALLVFNPSPTLITARLYQNEAQKLASNGLKVRIANERNEILQIAKELLSTAKHIGFEEDDLKFGEYQELQRTLISGSDSDEGRTLGGFKNLIENMRLIKTAEEIKKIEKAQIISQKAFESLVKTLKVGQTEEEIAEKLAKIIKSLGGQGLAFESIVASGANSGKPHHVTGRRRLNVGDILLLDFGAKYQDYCADITRTIFIGRAKDEYKNIYELVRSAQKAAIKKIGAKFKTNQAFGIVNDFFKEQNLEENFLHGLGHGIGLAVHEPPYLRKSTDEELVENMVFSIEPGLYFPWGGVRIEDLVVIKAGKAKVLGEHSVKLIEIAA